MAAVLATVWLTGAAFPGEIELTPRELYEGFEARKVVLEESGTRLALDPRVFRWGSERRGVVVTDPIDLGHREGALGLAGRVSQVTIEVFAHVAPERAREVEVRTGPNLHGKSGWSPW